MQARPRIYLDHAATSFPKPAVVWEAMDRFNRRIGANAGRGSYRSAVESSAIVASCRERLRRLLDVPESGRIVFTLNATDALNLALKGVLRTGDHVVTTLAEHNSVLRPLRSLERERGVRVSRVAVDATGRVAASDVARALTSETRLVAVTAASNVTGALQPIEEIATAAHAVGALLLVDGAQTVGGRVVHPRALGADLLAFAGHKGLLGPLGTGALYVAPGIDVQPLREGGTGSRSERDVQPDEWPDHLEAGSHNVPGLAGLDAALGWILERGVESLQRHKQELCARFLERTRGLGGVTIWGPADPLAREPVFPVRVAGFDAEDLAAVLDAEFGIESRSGLHCAPGMHAALGTLPGGVARLSFGPFNTAADVDAAVAALARLAPVSGLRTDLPPPPRAGGADPDPSSTTQKGSG